MEALATALANLCLEADLQELEHHIEGDIVVVDSYRHRADDGSVVKARVTAAVDDLERDLDVDVLVDPSPGASSATHRRAALVLAGGEYALVDPALASVPSVDIKERVGHAFVAVGGSDTTGIGARLATELGARLPDAAVQLAAGPWAKESQVAAVEIVRTESGLAPFLACADLVLTAGGVTMLESLCLGRPTVAVVLHENQRRPAEGAAAAGAVLLATPEDAPGVAARLAADHDKRVSLAGVARRVIDGFGARRVAEAITQRVSSK